MTPPENAAPPPLPSDAAARAAEKQERLARAYDADIAPLYGSRFAELARRAVAAFGPKAGPRVVEVGCATGELTLALAGLPGVASLTALDEAPAFVTRARARVDAERA
ncbi:MAG TPA: class I SAM-dependent methyltransferase, partial [Polyangia bacterium]|nr:class I SAM-dependent methyltransferase [Polyangia bacterium]